MIVQDDENNFVTECLNATSGICNVDHSVTDPEASINVIFRLTSATNINGYDMSISWDESEMTLVYSEAVWSGTPDFTIAPDPAQPDVMPGGIGGKGTRVAQISFTESASEPPRLVPVHSDEPSRRRRRPSPISSGCPKARGSRPERSRSTTPPAADSCCGTPTPSPCPGSTHPPCSPFSARCCRGSAPLRFAEKRRHRASGGRSRGFPRSGPRCGADSVEDAAGRDA